MESVVEGCESLGSCGLLRSPENLELFWQHSADTTRCYIFHGIRDIGLFKNAEINHVLAKLQISSYSSEKDIITAIKINDQDCISLYGKVSIKIVMWHNSILIYVLKGRSTLACIDVRSILKIGDK